MYIHDNTPSLLSQSLNPQAGATTHTEDALESPSGATSLSSYDSSPSRSPYSHSPSSTSESTSPLSPLSPLSPPSSPLGMTPLSPQKRRAWSCKAVMKGERAASGRDLLPRERGMKLKVDTKLHEQGFVTLQCSNVSMEWCALDSHSGEWCCLDQTESSHNGGSESSSPSLLSTSASPCATTYPCSSTKDSPSSFTLSCLSEDVGESERERDEGKRQANLVLPVGLAWHQWRRCHVDALMIAIGTTEEVRQYSRLPKRQRPSKAWTVFLNVDDTTFEAAAGCSKLVFLCLPESASDTQFRNMVGLMIRAQKYM